MTDVAHTEESLAEGRRANRHAVTQQRVHRLVEALRKVGAGGLRQQVIHHVVIGEDAVQAGPQGLLNRNGWLQVPHAHIRRIIVAVEIALIRILPGGRPRSTKEPSLLSTRVNDWNCCTATPAPPRYGVRTGLPAASSSLPEIVPPLRTLRTSSPVPAATVATAPADVYSDGPPPATTRNVKSPRPSTEKRPWVLP